MQAKTQIGDLGLVMVSPEVYYTETPTAVLGREAATFLIERASALPRRRCRICLHGDPFAPVHEMLIAHHRNCYVRPHRHLGKPESTTVVDGRGDLVIFHPDGSVAEVVRLNPSRQDGPHYCRIAPDTWHSLVIHSEWLIFFEVGRGPFDPATAEFAPWAPDENDAVAVREYQDNLRQTIAGRVGTA